MTRLNEYYQISELIAAYLADEEKAMPAALSNWIAESKANEAIFLRLIKEEQLKASIKRYNEIDAAAAWASVSSQLGLQEPNPVPASLVKLWKRYIGIAAAVATIVFGVWVYNKVASLQNAPGNNEWVKNDVAPGKNTATLTLNGGKAITLSEAKTGVIIDASQIKYNDGTALKADKTQTLTLTTPRGGTYQVRLPDGTNVWLNAASSLTYTTALKERGVERVVRLSGEAYFEVFRNVLQPFVVKTSNQSVTVLGTHFNVNAYTDEGRTVTTLVEGSVRVATSSVPGQNAQGAERVLKPNEQSVLSNNDIQVNPANVEQVMAWKNGYFLFENEDIKSIMRKISRWYNVDIVYEGNIAGKTIEGTVSKFKNISTVLEMLSDTKVVKFKLEGKTLRVMPGERR